MSRTTLLVLAVVAGGVAVAGLRNPRDAQGAQVTPRGEALPSIRRVTFPHRRHFEEFGLECKTCHHETNASELRMPHKDYFDDFWIDCQICHKSGGAAAATPQACSNCHHGSPTNIADETLSAKVVIHKKCWECHDSGTGDKASNGCGKCHVKAAGANAAPDSSGASSKKG